MKKHLLFLFAALLPMLASAHAFEVGGIYYNITSSSTAEVTYMGNSYDDYDNDYSGSIILPATVTHEGVNYNVTSIGDYAFWDCSSLTAITIPESVTSIGKDAFEDCSSLTAITIPESVTSIGDAAFRYCSSITSINIPKGVTSLGHRAFMGCVGVKSIAISENLVSIGMGAFALCKNLSSIVVDKKNAVYDSRNNCNAIIETNTNTLIAGCPSTIIPNTVESIAYGALSGLPSAITIPNSVINIGEYAFSNSEFTSIDLPNSVRNIERCAFFYCEKLVSIDIPDGVVSIQESAFYNCTSLTDVYIPKSVEEISYYAFLNCTSLTSITIPENVTSIKDHAFYGCESLTAITIPESVTSIGDWAFAGCTSLTAITCEAKTPPTLEGSYVFTGVNKSIPLYVPAGSVEAYKVASYWSNFTNIQAIPSSDIASGTCGDNLTWRLTEEYELIIEGTGAMYDFSSDGAPWYEYRESIKAVTINEGATSIGEWAFYHCSSLTAITIPEGVTSIGDAAFRDCSSLTSITISESVTSIGHEAFYGCRSLASITIPEGVTSIGEGAFSGCSSLTSIIIPESVTSIEDWAFAWCSSLTAITVAEGNTKYDSRGGCNAIIETNSNTLIAGCSTTIIPESVTSIGYAAFHGCSSLTYITIPEGVTSIGTAAFASCSSLTSITIPEGVTSIGGDAFFGCSSLTAITLPEGVTYIGDDAFGGCSSLTSITIPEGVTSIGRFAFAWCRSLTSITCEAVTPPTIDNSTFDDVDKTIPLYVPAGSVEAYRSAEYWNEFTNIQSLPLDLSSVVYLKNVSTGKFLTAANSWGTQASLGDHGLDVTLALLPNGKYTIETRIKNNDTDHYLGSNLYVDASATEWTISEQGGGYYTLSVDGVGYLGCDDTNVLVHSCTDPTDESVQWQLLTKEDLVAELGEATFVHPVDATFFIQGANFGRNDQRNGAWQQEPVLGGDNENFCAEKWNAGTFVISQTLTGLPNGLYKLQAQGFYRMGDANDAIALRNEGAEVYDVKFFANADYVNVMSVLDEAGKLNGVGSDYEGYGAAPNTMSEASKFFSAGHYQHELYFTVTDGTAVVGIANNSGVYHDWTCFDNFELYYCGTSVQLSDSQESYTQAEDEVYSKISYTRNFKNTNWQALYVPFEIPITEAFLAEFEVAYIYDARQYDRNDDGIKDETIIESFKKKSGVLEANYPYLIRAKEVGEKTITVTDATLYATKETGFDCSSVFDTYTFTGTYSRIPAAQLPQNEGYYALSGGVWQPIASGSSLGAFRFYMQIESRNGGSAPAQTIRMRVIDEDDATEIDNAEFTDGNSQLIIYDLQGRRITDTANLKGVYIVNGKKVIF